MTREILCDGAGGLGGRLPIRFYQPLPARQGTEGVFKDHL
jgi:hypothetical protein